MTPIVAPIVAEGTGSDAAPQRLSKLLAARGIASRSEADRMIERGWVSINGRVAQPGDRALPDAAITLAPEAQARLQGAVTVLLNKPRGFVSAPDETGGARALSLLVPENFGDLGQPPTLDTWGLRVAGRLAVGDCGLVVYTSDSALARRLAAAGVDEEWLLTFEPAATGNAATDPVAVLRAALLNAGCVAQIVARGDALVITAGQLGKGILAGVIAELGWSAQLRRLRRGEIALPAALGEGQWQLRSSPA